MMKKLLAGVLLFSVLSNASAQSSRQVNWTYSAKKIAEKTYEVHMTAIIKGEYHLYAQQAGVEGPLPTGFTFTVNPLFTLEGKVKEVGKMIKKNEEVWGGMVNYYERTVDFVQVVKLKGNVKTSLAGKVEFMVCNNNECLAPSDVSFNVSLGG
jgi:thiol:disulfide interchange protein DsbD